LNWKSALSINYKGVSIAYCTQTAHIFSSNRPLRLALLHQLRENQQVYLSTITSDSTGNSA
jgi:hypothetical protein